MEVKIVDVTIPGDEQVNERKIENIEKYWLLNPLSANPTKWTNTLKQFVSNLQFPDKLFEYVWPFCDIST